MFSNRGQIERRRRRLRAELRALSEQPLMRGSVVERLLTLRALQLRVRT